MTTAQKTQRLARIFLHLTTAKGMTAEQALEDIQQNLGLSRDAILLAITGKIA